MPVYPLADGDVHPAAVVCVVACRCCPGGISRSTRPGAQLRFTDLDGNRLTAFATSMPGGQLPDLNCGTAAAPRTPGWVPQSTATSRTRGPAKVRPKATMSGS